MIFAYKLSLCACRWQVDTKEAEDHAESELAKLKVRICQSFTSGGFWMVCLHVNDLRLAS